jgi:hypothetical protein
MKLKNITIMIFIALISPLAALAVDCGGSGCKVCETTTCSGEINMGGWANGVSPNANGTITCSNGYYVMAGVSDNYGNPLIQCYKDGVLQYSIKSATISTGSTYHIDSAAVIAFIRMCTGM